MGRLAITMLNVSGKQQQNASPTTGQTVQLANTSDDLTLFVTPASGLLALTVTLPTDAASVIGQTVLVTTSKAITALTVNGAATIVGLPVGLVLGGTVKLIKTAVNTWFVI